MAVSSIKRRSGGPIRSNIAKMYMIAIEVEVDGTSITSNDPTAGFTVAHAGTAGDYIITFDSDAKPRSVWAGIPLIEEDLPTESAKWTGYDRATGVGTFTCYDGATEVAANFVGTLKIVLFCSDSRLAD